MYTIDTDYEAGIQACQECILACEVCISDMIVKKSDNDCPACCRQCVDVCSLCIRAMAGDWVHVANVCRLTSEVCAWSAHNCRQIDNEHCRKCAEACERCARACHELAR